MKFGQRFPDSCLAVLGVCALSCRAVSSEHDVKPPGKVAAVPQPGASERSAASSAVVAEVTGSTTFLGMCDASGGVRLRESLIVVADDDDNVLRTYDAERGGLPVASADLSAFIGGSAKSREAEAARDEADIEAGALAFGKAFWVTSHARGSKGKKDDSLSRFFATAIPTDSSMEPSGSSYTDLRRDMIDSPVLHGLKLGKAAKRGPEDEGGFNIEGLALAPDGKTLLIGFRGPLENGRALVVPFTNPRDVSEKGAVAQFAAPHLLDLGGRGVRDLAVWNGRILVSAGPQRTEGDFALFAWDVARDVVTRIESPGFAGQSPEALLVFEDTHRVLALSDDGDVVRDGLKCGKLKPREARSFRGTWLRIVPW